MKTQPTEILIYRLTLIAKALLGVLQLLTAAVIWTGASDKVPDLAQMLVQAELAEDQGDFFANAVISLASKVPAANMTFYGAYFGLHGLLHIGVVIALLARAVWAHSTAVAILAAFVVYQLTDWFLHGGAMLLVLSAIDIFVIIVTIRANRAEAARISDS